MVTTNNLKIDLSLKKRTCSAPQTEASPPPARGQQAITARARTKSLTSTVARARMRRSTHGQLTLFTARWRAVCPFCWRSLRNEWMRCWDDDDGRGGGGGGGGGGDDGDDDDTMIGGRGGGGGGGLWR
eukprot:764254-Hanusia_phi.AAC.2